MYLGCGKYLFHISNKELILNTSEIEEIVEYYKNNINVEDNQDEFIFNTADNQMELFYKYYTENRITKKRAFIMVADFFDIQWKSVEKTYYKYRSIYEE